jgi:hypothetical protein
MRFLGLDSVRLFGFRILRCVFGWGLVSQGLWRSLLYGIVRCILPFVTLLISVAFFYAMSLGRVSIGTYHWGV